jgi:hypothetical protein
MDAVDLIDLDGPPVAGPDGASGIGGHADQPSSACFRMP